MMVGQQVASNGILMVDLTDIEMDDGLNENSILDFACSMVGQQRPQTNGKGAAMSTMAEHMYHTKYVRRTDATPFTGMTADTINNTHKSSLVTQITIIASFTLLAIFLASTLSSLTMNKHPRYMNNFPDQSVMVRSSSQDYPTFVGEDDPLR